MEINSFVPAVFDVRGFLIMWELLPPKKRDLWKIPLHSCSISDVLPSIHCLPIFFLSFHSFMQYKWCYAMSANSNNNNSTTTTSLWQTIIFLISLNKFKAQANSITKLRINCIAKYFSHSWQISKGNNKLNFRDLILFVKLFKKKEEKKFMQTMSEIFLYLSYCFFFYYGLK